MTKQLYLHLKSALDKYFFKIKIIFAKIFLKYFLPRIKDSSNIISETQLILLVRHTDILMMICNLRSLFFWMDCSFPIMIIGDGSLTKGDLIYIKKCFPDAIITSTTGIQRSYNRMHFKYKLVTDFFLEKNNSILRYKLLGL